MKVKTTNQLPPFLAYGKADAGNEAIQDFFLAWTINCSSEKYQPVNPVLNDYARRIIYIMIHGKHGADDRYAIPDGIDITKLPKNYRIESVKVVRQETYIDLYAEVTIANQGKYILNIENKFYSDLKEHQLVSAKKYLRGKYGHIENDKFIDLVIHCDEEKIFARGTKKAEGEKLRSLIIKHDYKFPDIYTIAKLAGMRNGDANKLTGNAMFDEYWFLGYRDID